MIKDFSAWFLLKGKLNNRKSNLFFKEREIWWCHIGTNVGDEEDGKTSRFSRPVIIIKKFNNNLFCALPMTTKNKENRYYHQIDFQGRAVSIMLSQIRVLDKKRLTQRLGTLNDNDFITLREKLRKLF